MAKERVLLEQGMFGEKKQSHKNWEPALLQFRASIGD